MRNGKYEEKIEALLENQAEELRRRLTACWNEDPAEGLSRALGEGISGDIDELALRDVLAATQRPEGSPLSWRPRPERPEEPVGPARWSPRPPRASGACFRWTFKPARPEEPAGPVRWRPRPGRSITVFPDRFDGLTGFEKMAFPLVRRVFTQLATNDIVSVQPMRAPTGLVFYTDFSYEANREEGESIYGEVPLAQEGPFVWRSRRLASVRVSA